MPHSPLPLPHSFTPRRSSDLPQKTVFVYTSSDLYQCLPLHFHYPFVPLFQALSPCYFHPALSQHVAHLSVQTQIRSEEHTSELQSRGHLVCCLLLVKKN